MTASNVFLVVLITKTMQLAWCFRVFAGAMQLDWEENPSIRSMGFSGLLGKPFQKVYPIFIPLPPNPGKGPGAIAGLINFPPQPRYGALRFPIISPSNLRRAFSQVGTRGGWGRGTVDACQQAHDGLYGGRSPAAAGYPFVHQADGGEWRGWDCDQ